MIDLFQPGAYARAAGGNLERPDLQAPVIKWMAWSLNADNGGGGQPQVWDRCRALWNGAGILNFPWLHCRNLADVDRLILTARNYGSQAIGLNIEDVNGDKLDLQVVGQKIQAWGLPVHMATLDWVQNGQGWQHLLACVVALEFFPGEGSMKNGYSSAIAHQCIDHAHAEGLTKVTPIFKTKGLSPATYGADYAICHSLYTADDITPDAPSWNAWKASTPCTKTEKVTPVAPNLKRKLYGPDSPAGPSKGRDVKDFVKRTLNRLPAQIPVGGNFFPKPLGGFDDVYNAKTVQAIEVVRVFNDITPVKGPFGQADLNALWQYADAYSKWVYRIYIPPKPAVKVPELGPVWPGGASVLFHSLTHETDGFPNPQHPESSYPAFDDGWVAGRAVIAPEDLVVTDQSSSLGGDAFYATGKSKLKYWFGHLAWAPPTGRSFKKGETMGVIAHLTSSQGSSHVHTGINAVPLIGHDFEHKTNYQTGSPSVGEQLRWGLS